MWSLPGIQDLVEIVLVGGALAVSLTGLVCLWEQRTRRNWGGALTISRRFFATVGLFAATGQAMLFIAIWTPLSRSPQ